MLQLISHLLGDYVLQNHWMAGNKTTRSFPALVHVLFYAIPFAILIGCFDQGSWWSLLVIVSTHFVIDRFRLAKYWMSFWGVGEPGYLFPKVFGVTGEVAPPWLAVWLLIIVDNTAHLLINWAALEYL